MSDTPHPRTGDPHNRAGQRVTSYVPNELYTSFKDAFPEANVSSLLQEAMRGLMSCEHDDLGCLKCGHPEPRRAIELQALGKFFRDAMWRIGELGRTGGTAEGAQRVLKDVGERFEIAGAKTYTLTRPTRAQREAAKVKDLPPPKKPAASKSQPSQRPRLEVIERDREAEAGA